MSNELLKKDQELATTLSKNDLSDVLKPLTQEIFLFDTYVAGTSHLEDKSVLEDIKSGDKLILQREDNKFDKKAIMIMTEDKRKVGYVPEKDNVVFSRLMDAGKFLSAKITDIMTKGTYTRITINIYLVDF
jgi:hypothetical protein